MIAPFCTPLDPQETTASSSPTEPVDPSGAAQSSLHMQFRHGFWQNRRHKTYEALVHVPDSGPRRHRFELCGEGAWIQVSNTKPPRYRIRSRRCHDRFCEACAREKRNLVASNLYRAIPDKPLRLLTLTLKANGRPLTEQLKRLYSTFTRFRNAAAIKRLMWGGVSFLEVTYNAKTSTWHPHLHIIFEGLYLPTDIARSTWLSLTGDSYIIDVRFIRNTRLAASYVTKYAAKTINASVWTIEPAFIEALEALQHCRTFNTFGTWRALKLTVVPEDDTLWVDLAPLAHVLFQARQGDPVARDIANDIRRYHVVVDNAIPPAT